MKKRKIFVKTTTKRKVLYKKKKPKMAKCKICGEKLKGVLRENPSKMKNIAKTKKRPSRKYGGVICHSCLREKVAQEARKNV